MKKVLITICLGAMFLTSCGGPDAKADAKKIGDLTCKAQKETDPAKQAELLKEVTDASLKIMEAYKGDADAAVEYTKAMAAYKCE